MAKYGSANWKGNLRTGSGSVSTESRALNAPYAFKTRFEDAPGNNPEELIGAAQAACYSMALAMELEQRNMKPESIYSKSQVQLEQRDGGFVISSVHVTVEARVPGAFEEVFLEAADAAKASCPVTKLIAEMTLVARLLD